MPNPFFSGGYITDPSHFVGRGAELRKIFSELETAHTGQLKSISVVGPRRLGKSSLLYHVTQVYAQHLSRPDEYRFAYMDLEDPHCRTLSGLLGFVLDRLRVVHSAQVSLTEFQESVEKLTGATEGRVWPVVCLDEFENLTKNRTEFPDTLFDAWRALINASRIAFITASRTSLAQLSRAGQLTSPFFNVFTEIDLGKLTEEEARFLAERGRTCDRPFSDEEIKMILRVAREHPLKLQVAGSLVYEAKADRRMTTWRMIKAEYRRQVNYMLGVRPMWRRVVDDLDVVLQHLGRVAWLILKREPADAALYRTVGALIVIVVFLLVFGIVGWERIVSLVKALMGVK